MRVWARIVVGLLVLAAGACAPSPPGPGLIGAHQHFRGLVNGAAGEAVVTTVCAGPVWEGRTEPPVAGQTLSVVYDETGAGNTGRASVLFAQPSPDSMTVVPFDRYGVDAAFPTDVQVPCDGTGLVTFTPCFGVVPCFEGAEADVVKVRFVNIAD